MSDDQLCHSTTFHQIIITTQLIFKALVEKLVFEIELTVKSDSFHCYNKPIVKWANDGKMLVKDSQMLVNDGEMSVWSYTNFTIID